MQKLIAKYGVAAHLALLAVAPLFLFPFCGDVTVARVLVWLSLPTALWIVLEPSMRGGEHLHDARRRVAKAVARDPLFWASLVLVAFTGFRALNTGIAISYNAETAVWYVSEPPFPILPGVVGASGDLSFAASLACMIIMQGCRHSLGRSARMSFFLLASCLSGLAVIVALLMLHEGVASVAALLPSAEGPNCSFMGFACGFYLIGGLVALVAVAENGWRMAFFLVLLAIGGNFAGLFVFAPAYLSVAMAAMAVIMTAYMLLYSCLKLPGSDGMKLLVIGGVSAAIGGLLVFAILPKSMMDARLAAFARFELFPPNYWEMRKVLSAVAFKSWIAHIWIGTGISSFPFDFRFAARAEDWVLLPRGAAMLANGWWLLLVERGLVGAVFFALPFGFLVFTYFSRLIGWVRALSLPHPACLIAPLSLLLFVAAGFYDCSPLRIEVLLAMCAFLAVSAASFQRMRGGRNG